MKIKPAKFVRLYGAEIELERCLTDQEVRLFHLLLRLVVWDQKKIETFGSVRLTVRQISKEYLPWSSAKVSNVINSLIIKGLLSRRQDRLLVKDYQAYRMKNVNVAEQIIQSRFNLVQTSNQTVQPVNQTVQPNENKQLGGFAKFQENMKEFWAKDKDSVQPNGQAESLNKPKEI